MASYISWIAHLIEQLNDASIDLSGLGFCFQRTLEHGFEIRRVRNGVRIAFRRARRRV